MGTKHKTPEVLDAMIEHVRYEVVQIIHFARFGNNWCDVLHPDLGQLAQRSMLEAGLVHLRCLIEFLGDQPASDQVMARDYVPDWDWKTSEQLGQVGELHGRLAHLGTVRQSVSTDGDFSWQSWLTNEASTVLRGFRDFLVQLRSSSPRRYQLFIQPRDELPAIDLLPLLNSMLHDEPR